jgi:homoserine dehydrogenase
MSTSGKEVKVAIIGLGQVGSTFLEKLAEKSGNGVAIVAAAELDQSAPGVEVAKKKGINVVSASKDVIAMGESIDIIFDLTGSADAKRALRSELARSGNQHTVLAPEIVAFLMWDLMGEGSELSTKHGSSGY